MNELVINGKSVFLLWSWLPFGFSENTLSHDLLVYQTTFKSYKAYYTKWGLHIKLAFLLLCWGTIHPCDHVPFDAWLTNWQTAGTHKVRRL